MNQDKYGMKVKSIIRALLVEIRSLLFNIVLYWPTTRFGNWLRYFIYSKQLSKLGRNVIFYSGVRLNSAQTIEIGNDCYFTRNVNIDAGNSSGIYIGSKVAIADGTYLRSANHVFDDLNVPIFHQGHSSKKLEYNGKQYSIVIEDDVWIGARAIILSGAYISKGCVISAGAVVSAIVPPNSIVVGNPGRVISNREKRR